MSYKAAFFMWVLWFFAYAAYGGTESDFVDAILQTYTAGTVLLLHWWANA